MKITIRYENPTTSHCDVRLWVNGALAGILVLRQEELGSFQQILSMGCKPPMDEFLAEGNPDATVEVKCE